MEKYKSPSYPWYAKEALSSTTIMLMTLAEEGAYRRLLDIQWEDGSIPDDIETLARLLRTNTKEVAKIWARVGPCFVQEAGNPGRLVNARLEEVRAAQANYHAGRVASGYRGAEARYKKAYSSPTSPPIADLEVSHSLLLKQVHMQEQVQEKREEESPRGETFTPPLAQGFTEAFATWASTLPASSASKAKPNEQRRAKYDARRREGYSHEEIMAALKNYVHDDWPDRTAKASAREFTNLLKSGAQVEKFSVMTPGGQGPATAKPGFFTNDDSQYAVTDEGI